LLHHAPFGIDAKLQEALSDKGSRVGAGNRQVAKDFTAEQLSYSRGVHRFRERRPNGGERRRKQLRLAIEHSAHTLAFDAADQEQSGLRAVA
jgi:hypothetical protein